ncbi:prostaglandin E synthase 2 isoform X2 [Nematostella vectensis]|uniref:prostaglandin E synthase 2 isoform X2 n=1 Tax=Nematostella vectensis TaxID=45351 RepID=UPI0020775E5B|nr:prostaglandin E synthase 2 isoform X2 [Nematostella vectensis]
MAAYTRPMSSCFSRGRNLFNKCPYKELSFVTRRNNATFSHAAKNRSVLLGVGALAGISFGVLYSLKTQSRIAREIEQENYSSENSASNEASHQPKITLYQYQTCPFCCKVRAYLEYFGIDYTKVEVNPLTRKEIEFSTEYRKVPIAIVDGKQINDSSVIISTLYSSQVTGQSPETILPFYPEMKYKDEKGKEKVEYANRHAIMYLDRVDKKLQEKLMEERRWREWVDKTFVHTLSPNIYRTTAEAMQAFEYFSSVGNFSTMERYSVRYFGAFTMYILGKHLKTRYPTLFTLRAYGCTRRGFASFC